MTLQEAQAFVDAHRKVLEAEQIGESDRHFEHIWAKFQILNFDLLRNRCQTDEARAVVEERFKECSARVMAALLSRE